MIYVDTNVLLSLLCEDGLTLAAERWHRSTEEPLAISLWTVIEFRSNIGIRIRKKMLSRVAGLAVISEFDRVVNSDMHCLVSIEKHFVQARDWLANPDCSFRSGDALHLAIAFGHGCREVISFDRPLGAAARKLRLPVRILSN